MLQRRVRQRPAGLRESICHLGPSLSSRESRRVSTCTSLAKSCHLPLHKIDRLRVRPWRASADAACDSALTASSPAAARSSSRCSCGPEIETPPLQQPHLQRQPLQRQAAILLPALFYRMLHMGCRQRSEILNTRSGAPWREGLGWTALG